MPTLRPLIRIIHACQLRILQLLFINRIRRKRLRHFLALIDRLPRHPSIIDIGDTENFWQMTGTDLSKVKITLYSFRCPPPKDKRIAFIQGDMRSIGDIEDKSCDVAFSNSTTEHLAHPKDCQKIAPDLRRIAKKYYLQTPNKYSPIEPHFVCPLFQLLPPRIQLWLTTHLALGYIGKQNKEDAHRILNSIHLLTRKDLHGLFPEGQIFEERFWGLTKSFVIYGEW